MSAGTILAVSYAGTGRSGETIELLERVLADSQRILGCEHPVTLSARRGLVDAYRSMLGVRPVRPPDQSAPRLCTADAAVVGPMLGGRR